MWQIGGAPESAETFTDYKAQWTHDAFLPHPDPVTVSVSSVPHIAFL
jgi:hypothetical protein